MEDAAKIRASVTVFAASPADDASIAAAKEYIGKNELTGEDVKLGRQGNTIVVIAQREIKLLF